MPKGTGQPPAEGTGTTQPDLLDKAILGDPDQETEFDEEEPPITEDSGDLGAVAEIPDLEPVRKATKQLYQTEVRAILAQLEPSVGLAFEAWLLAHPQLRDAAETNRPRVFSFWVAQIAADHLRMDEARPAGQRQYDWEALHIRALTPLLQEEWLQREAQVGTKIRRDLAESIRRSLREGVDEKEVVRRLLAEVAG